MTPQERFAEDYGMPLETVRAIATHADRAGRCNEKQCNGDPHPHAKNRTDKNECSQLWDAEVGNETVKIADLARPYGFTGIEYTGLYPTLKRGKQFVEIPY